MSFHQDFNLFIGGKTGILKGAKINNEKTIIKNLHNAKTLSAHNEITVMCWGDATETDILIGTKEQTVKVFDSEFKAFSSCIKAKLGEGPIVGLTRFNNLYNSLQCDYPYGRCTVTTKRRTTQEVNMEAIKKRGWQDAQALSVSPSDLYFYCSVITTCSASGHIKVWKYSKEAEIEINTKAPVEKMESTGLNTGIIATGGRGNDLKLWDLTKQDRIFMAKNVRPNELDLEVPVWISDLKIFPATDYRVAVCTRYGHVRLYDTKAQRRPVVEVTLPDQSLQCIDLTYRDNQIVVGSGTGYIMLIDLRMSGNGQPIASRVVSTFKGATGSVRQVACHKSKPYLASVGLDSYFRLHHLETKKILHQQFMQVKLNAVLMRSSFNFEPEQEIQTPLTTEPAPSKASEELNWMFDSMETVGAKRPRTSL